MSYLLEVLGRGLLSELSAAFRNLLVDDDRIATRELERAVSCEPYDINHQRRLGLRCLRDRQYGRAAQAFEEVLRLDSGDLTAQIGLACIHDDLGNTRAALEQLEKLPGESQSEATCFAIGFLQEKLGQTRRAIESYRSALRINPQLRNAHERLAAAYLKLDDTASAISHYEQLSWHQPGDMTIALTLGNLYLRAGRFEEAARSFEHAIIADPDNWEARDDFVSTCVQAGKLEEALEALQEMISRRPECADQYLRLGDLYTRMGRPPEALKAYTKAINLHPDYLEATIKLGTAHLREGAFVQAAKAFARAVEINDRVMNAFVGLGVAQLALNNVEDAKASLEMAAGAEPNSLMLFREVARLQLKVAAAKQAAKYTAPREVACRPEGPRPENVEQMLTEQIVRLSAAVERHPNHADLHYRVGLLQRAGGKLEEAIASFRRAVSINPRYMKALVKLTTALREAGRLDEAIEAATQALDADAESIELHYQLGLIFADRRQFAYALEHFDRAVADAPTNLDYTANLALALQNMGLLDRAAETWRTLCELSDEATLLPQTATSGRFRSTQSPLHEPPG